MNHSEQIKIVTFYKFVRLGAGSLPGLRSDLRAGMKELGIKGTVILATEGINSTVCGPTEAIDTFVSDIERVLELKIDVKVSFHSEMSFRRIDVKIKPEIVTLKKDVDIDLGVGTHVPPNEWNRLIADENTFVLDTRNDYEFQTGTFPRAVNPGTKHFSELPDYVEHKLDPSKHKNIAMFCTGGIRCEKFAPYMKGLGFENVYQLEGGILKYLEEVNRADSLWEGECFVFDSRVSVDLELKKGSAADLSQETPK